jgi:exosortase N
MSPELKFALRWVTGKGYHTLALLLAAGMVGGAFAFPASFLAGANVLLGFCLVPFVMFFSGKRRFNYVYLLFVISFGVIAFAYNVRTFYFFMLAFYSLLVVESFIGKTNSLILFLIAFMSPFFHQVSVILGFPLRLQLSQWAGSILAIAGLDIQVEGNMMVLNGGLFTVDEACMGLSMLAISLLMGVAAIAHHYRVFESRLNLFFLTAFFTGVLILNLVSNLLRIIVLVIFQILPDNLMHEVIGIVCLILYVIVPLYFLSQWMVKKFGKHLLKVDQMKAINVSSKSILVTLAALVILVGFRIDTLRKSPSPIDHANVELPNVQVEKMNDGITKMYNEKMLVYVKPIPEFFTGEHTPLLCWKGSGYEFRSIKKTFVAGREIYFGQLDKTGEKLFTAWWYSNGKTLTIDQWEWRSRMLKGEEKFCLVNITTKDEKSLEENVALIFENNLLVHKSESHVNR